MAVSSRRQRPTPTQRREACKSEPSSSAKEYARGPQVAGLAQGRVADVGVERVGVDHLARVHQAVRVPQGLELPEGPHQLGAEHLLQQLAAALAVTVLAREGTSHGDDEVGGGVDVTAVVAQPVRARKVEVVAGVDAALAEMPVPGA